MAFAHEEMTVKEIKEKIKSHREEIPQLQDVTLSQNKQPLIDDAVAAVETYYMEQQGLGGGDMEMETAEASELHVDGVENESTAPDSDEEDDEETAPTSQQSDTLGGAANPLTP